MQNEELALLEATVSGKATTANAKPAAKPLTPDAPSGDRLAQIRGMRRNDPNGYDSDHAIQAEELSLIAATLPTSQTGQPALATTGDVATQQTNQGAA